MRYVAKTVALLAATISLCSAAQAEPLISAFIGTQTTTSKLAYFVLDFNDPGPNPETYAFGWYYEGAKTGSDFVSELAGSLTGANGFVQTGASGGFITRMGYSGRVLDGNVNPVGYWNLWLGFDGTNWTNSELGSSSITLGDTPTFSSDGRLNSASWTGWRWVNDFNTDAPVAPRTPQQIVVAVPEPGVVTLFGAGLGVGFVLVRRRKRG
ncbi:MAG: PEP-CTERM sorting domain-containing protein [Akkermansiaceae bacterium]|nr:PEP-CTERM sorting domain-containing protein [Armatimonadota bacterium]